MSVLVIGAGAYGLALSNSIKGEVFVYSSIKDEIDLLNKNHKSELFDVRFSDNIHFVSEIYFSYDLVVLALPTNIIKSELSKLNLRNVPVIIASKGVIEGKYIYDILDFDTKYILSGPSFAKDMINNEIITLTLAGGYLDIFKDNIKLEYTNDIVGVEICGVVKNIFAISCGILKGMNVSDSTYSAYLNLVINETKKILVSNNCDFNTLFLSCGIGDIILTCTNNSSRNYTLGYMIGSGVTNKDIVEYLNTNTVEGISALKTFKVESELINLIYNIIFNNVNCNELLKYILK